MRKIYSTLIILLLIAPAVQAKDANREFATYGKGGASCADYSKARAAGGVDEDEFRQWLSGYISAFNLIIGSTYDLFGSTDFEGLMTWLDDRCQKYPRANLTNTVARFTEITFPYRKEVKPDNSQAKE